MCMIYVFIALIYLPLPSQGSNEICTEVSFHHNYQDTKKHINMTISADMNLFKKDKIFFLRSSNVTGIDTSSFMYIRELCYGDNQCNRNFSSFYDYTLNLNNPQASFIADFEVHRLHFTLAYIINGSISDAYGLLYNPKKPCVINYDKDYHITTNQTTCCTKFEPSLVASSNVSRCKRFRSRTTLLNSDYSINATSSMNYTLIDGQLITEGDYSLDEHPLLKYYLNENDTNMCTSKNNTELKCNITLPIEDSRNFISLDFYYSVLLTYVPMIGSFILRNNQTLMYDEIPFTPKNDCSYFSYHALNSNDRPNHSEFCCKEFE